MNNLNDVLESLRAAQRIGISFHTSPDGDSLGSSLALLNILREIGKDVYIMSKESIPDSFTFLPNSFEILNTNSEVTENTDTVIILDCGNVERINCNLEFKNRNYKIINIDHHKSNELYGDVNYVNSSAAAVGEIIYDIMNLLNVELNKDIATCIYTSLLTDTGSFRFSNTTLKTHTIAGLMTETGINFPEIHRIIFEDRTYKRIKLYGKVIETLELECNGKVAVLYARKSYFDDLDIENDDTSDLIDFGSKINTVEVSVLLKESRDSTKVSLRSKDYVDVRKIAESFGGGGHIRASGFSVAMDIDYIKEKLVYKIKESLNERV